MSVENIYTQTVPAFEREEREHAWIDKKTLRRGICVVLTLVAIWGLLSMAFDFHQDYNAHFASAQKLYENARNHLKTDVCKIAELERDSGDFAGCKQSRDTIASRPEYTALTMTLHAYKLCGRNNCLELARNMFNSLSYMATGGGIVIGIIIVFIATKGVRMLSTNQEAKQMIPMFINMPQQKYRQD